MKKVFKNENLQQEFDRKGFVVLDLFTPKQAQDFIALYDQLEGVSGTLQTLDNSYELSFFEKDVASKKRKFDAVQQFMQPLLDEYLDDYHPLLINLFSKNQGTGEVPVHQNWTFVDEANYTSISVWCPLQNVSRENGTLEVVPGTQKTLSPYRGPSIPWGFRDIEKEVRNNFMLPLNLSLGQVGIIDDSVIHYSGENHTAAPRRAVQLIMKPTEAQLIHCVMDNEHESTIEIREVPNDYYFDFDMRGSPKEGISKQTIPYTVRQIAVAELEAVCHQNLHA